MFWDVEIKEHRFQARFSFGTNAKIYQDLIYCEAVLFVWLS